MVGAPLSLKTFTISGNSPSFLSVAQLLEQSTDIAGNETERQELSPWFSEAHKWTWAVPVLRVPLE